MGVPDQSYVLFDCLHKQRGKVWLIRLGVWSVFSINIMKHTTFVYARYRVC